MKYLKTYKKIVESNSPHIVDYLINKGYKPFRYKGHNLVHCDTFDFSTMVAGGIEVWLIKGNSCFIYGLNERNKPPTIISPRTLGLQMDDEMNRFIKNNTCEVIYNKLYPLSLE